jgi:predicted esterase
MDGFDFFTNNYARTETWTADDGRSFTLTANGIYKDVKQKPLGGTLYEFQTLEAGQPIVITDSSGRVISRDRGNLSFTFIVDFADGSENVDIKVAAPHPLFYEDLCKAVSGLTGTDSATYLTTRPIGSTDFRNGYYEYLPPSYTATGDAKSPLLLFFNGYGESGDGTPEGLSNMLFAGIPRYIDGGGWDTDRPFVVLSHQHVEAPGSFDFSSCDGALFGGSCNMQVQHDLDNAPPAFCTTPDEVHDFIDYAVSHYNVDPAQVYLTGLSCGAFGIWEYLAKYGDAQHVAAVVPIAGDGRPGSSGHYCDLTPTPIWAFHGAVDDVVDPNGSIEPMTALDQDCGADPERAKLTVYPDRDHNSWDPAYGGADGNDIYAWMLGFTNP